MNIHHLSDDQLIQRVMLKAELKSIQFNAVRSRTIYRMD